MNSRSGSGAGGAKASTSHGDRAGSNICDQVRALIRTEVSRAEPVDNARRSLELIVETSIRYRERNGELEITVVDDEGQGRTRHADGRTVPFSIADYVDELRHKHPTLFKIREAGAGVLPAREASSPDLIAEVPVGRPAEPQANRPGRPKPVRDWLDIVSPREVAAREELVGQAFPDQVSSGQVSREQGSSGQAPTGALRDRFGSVPAGASAAADAGFWRAARSMREALRARIDRAAARRSARQGSAVSLSRFLLPAFGAAAAFAAFLVASALVVPRLMDPSGGPAQVAELSPPSPRDPATTGTVAQVPATAPSPETTGSLHGVPEVLDTSTLRLQDHVVRLFGVEWARGGGDPDDLVKYLRGREVSCEPSGSADTYRCQVGGQDLSRVVLFNGGGRTTPDATAELRAAEDHARAARIGVWKEHRPASP